MHSCGDCVYCILWRGQVRCGRAETNYKEIDIFDNACGNFISFLEEDEES